jgi:hypothetical protein
MQLPEKYKEDFDVSSGGLSSGVKSNLGIYSSYNLTYKPAEY